MSKDWTARDLVKEMATVKKSTSSANMTPTSSAGAKSKKNESDLVAIQFDNSKISTLAQELSKKSNSWDELNWLLAEADIRLSAAFEGPNPFSINPRPSKVSIHKYAIPSKLGPSEIRPVAEKVASRRLSLQDLHWNLAERLYLLEQVKTH